MQSSSYMNHRRWCVLFIIMILFASFSCGSAQENANQKTQKSLLGSYTLNGVGTVEVYVDSIRFLGKWTKKDKDALVSQLKQEIQMLIDRLQKQGPMLKDDTRAVKMREVYISQKILDHIAPGAKAEPKQLDKSFLGNISFGDSLTIQVYGNLIKLNGKWSESDLDVVTKKLTNEVPMLKEQLKKQGPSLKEQTRNEKVREIFIKEKILEHIDAGRIGIKRLTD